jgi:hypothetical protein
VIHPNHALQLALGNSHRKALKRSDMHGRLSVLLTLTLVACVSTVGEPERIAGLAQFLAEPLPEILSYPRAITVDSSLIALRQEGIAAPLAGAFESTEEVWALLARIRDATPSLGHGVLKLVGSVSSDDASRAPDTPVLFVWPTWQVSYQRFPPRLDLVRLELGIIAKVIPRGQVMEGRGNLALKTASWEFRCHAYASNGGYFSISDWLSDGAARWRKALVELREVCGQQIGKSFERSAALLSDST